MSGEYMAAQMDRQIEGAQAAFEEVCHEADYLRDLVAWAYGKLNGRTFNNMDDALMLDRMKMFLEHRIVI